MKKIYEMTEAKALKAIKGLNLSNDDLAKSIQSKEWHVSSLKRTIANPSEFEVTFNKVVLAKAALPSAIRTLELLNTYQQKRNG